QHRRAASLLFLRRPFRSRNMRQRPLLLRPPSPDRIWLSQADGKLPSFRKERRISISRDWRRSESHLRVHSLESSRTSYMNPANLPDLVWSSQAPPIFEDRQL